ncbi:MAG: GvpL/GvpF family gas vesicle protein [Thermodesulfobacteriota bacterium]
MAQQQKYLYCIADINDRKEFGPIGIGDKEKDVYSIPFRDVGLLVSNFSPVAFDSIPKDTLLLYLATHQHVNEQMMENHTVIPVKFGTIFKDDDEIEEVLKRNYPQFKDALERMNNKIELEVVAIWNNMDSVLKEVGEGEDIKRFKGELMAKPSGATQSDGIELGKMVKSALDEKRDRIRDEILDGLKGCALDFIFHDLLDDTMIMNGAFLINRDKEEDFSQRIEDLNKGFREEIDFRIVGPLPPYSFSAIELKRMDIQKIDAAKKTLELSEEPTLVEIKEAYRRLIQRFHPDKNHDNPEVQKLFEIITKAHDILTAYCRDGRYSFKEKKDFIAVNVLDKSPIGGQSLRGYG